ncbi:MAG: sigma-70 family RNA polymerase sigma factor [Armatimonadota bacterium]|nr:sigma-70 family RNA polymerase sigma factor [Armatimonadota bacterium]
MAVSDRELVLRAQKGDLKAFDELVLRHNQRVYILARRILGNHEDALDVHQEAFLRAWKSIRKFRGDSEFSTWLYRITVNSCLSRKRIREQSRDHVEFDEEIAGHSGSFSTNSLEQTESVIAARQILSSLPERYRVFLILRELDGRSYEEIAEIMDCSVDTVKTSLYRARKQLLEKVAPRIEGEGL